MCSRVYTPTAGFWRPPLSRHQQPHDDHADAGCDRGRRPPRPGPAHPRPRARRRHPSPPSAPDPAARLAVDALSPRGRGPHRLPAHQLQTLERQRHPHRRLQHLQRSPPNVGPRCALTGGTWWSYYDDSTVTGASGLDIDQLVPSPKSGTPSGCDQHVYDSRKCGESVRDLNRCTSACPPGTPGVRPVSTKPWR